MSFIADLAQAGISPMQHFPNTDSVKVTDNTPLAIPGAGVFDAGYFLHPQGQLQGQLAVQGYLALQAAQAGTQKRANSANPEEIRTTRYGARITGRDATTGQYTFDVDTYGPIHGGIVWGASQKDDPSGTTRKVPLWTGAIAGMCPSKGGGAAAQPLPVWGVKDIFGGANVGAASDKGDPGIDTDGGLKALGQLISPASSAGLPKDFPGVIAPCSRTDAQQYMFVPAGNILVAPYKGSGGRATPVFDLTSNGALDYKNFAGLDTFWRVYDCGPGSKVGGSLAWQLGYAHSVQSNGAGAVADIPDSGGSGGSGQAPTLTDSGSDSQGNTTIDRNDLIVTNNQLYREKRTGFDAVALQGPTRGGGGGSTGGGSTGPAEVIAFATYREGGTHHVGAANDKHRIGGTKDGLVTNPLHFNPKANWFLDKDRDGPFKFDETPWKKPHADLPLIVEAYLRWDDGSAQNPSVNAGGAWNSYNRGGGGAGPDGEFAHPAQFRWESTSCADKALDGPPPPGIPDIPEIPNTPVFNTTRREEEFFTANQEPVPIAGRTRKQLVYNRSTLTQQVARRNLTTSAALAPVSSRPYLRTPMEFAVPALLARPQALVNRSTDYRYPDGALTPEQFAAYDTAPVAAKLEAYADQSGGGFQLQQTGQGRGFYAKGTSSRGGFALTPANVDLQDVILGRALPATMSEVHLTLATTGSKLNFADPTGAGAAANGFQHARSAAGANGSYPYKIEQLSPAGAVVSGGTAISMGTDAVGLNQAGTDTVITPSRGTGTQPGGKFRVQIGVTGASSSTVHAATSRFEVAHTGMLFRTSDSTTFVNFDSSTGGAVGFFGATPVVRQATFGALTDNTTGVPSTTYAAVPAAYSQADQQTRWASVANQLGAIRAALVAYGLST